MGLSRLVSFVSVSTSLIALFLGTISFAEFAIISLLAMILFDMQELIEKLEELR